MSFRQFGGLNYSARHNIVASNYNTSNNLFVSQNVGQPSSYINFLSDISGTDIYTGLTGPTGLPGEIGPTGGSLWNQEGATNIYYIGNVSINTSTTSLDFLQILGNNSTSSSQPPDSGSYHNLNLVSSKTGSTQYSMALGVDCSTGVGYINAAGNSDIQPVCLQTRGGVVGIGTTSPNINISLDVSGQLHTSGLISASAGVTGATGSFTNISVSEQLAVPGGITGATGSFTNISVSEQLAVPGGITGATGSFTNLQTSKDANINTITVGLGGGNISTNVALGQSALISNTTGNYNIAVGFEPLLQNTTGSNNIAVGIGTLLQNINGYNNTAVGSDSLYTNINGYNNTVVGYGTLFFNTLGNYNCAFGVNSLYNNKTGNYNCAFGVDSLLNSGGNNNTAYGYYAGSKNSGSNNTYLGYNTDANSAESIYTQSTALGANAIIDASNEIVLGTSTESIKIPGSYVGIGGNYNPGNGYALDVSGTGHFTGQIIGATGSFTNLSASQQIIGAKGSFTNLSASQQIIGATGSFTNLSASQQIIGATGSFVNLKATYVGIGGSYNPTSGYALDVNGNARATSFSSTSDYRIKENIEILNETHNIDSLRPVTYFNKKTKKQDFGLIAHELQEHFPCLVNGEKDGEELQNVNYFGLTALLIKEIQQLKNEIKLLKEKI